MAEKQTILVVDDEPNIRRILQAAFDRDGFRVLTAESGLHAMEMLQTETPRLMISDVLMPDMTGTELLDKVRESHPDMNVIMMTAYGTIRQAVDAIRKGAWDYVSKPFDLDALKRVAKSALDCEPETKTKSKRKTKSSESPVVIAESPVMKEILALVRQVADSRATVLLTGESGTGKEVIAKTIHSESGRAAKPFVAVSCAALPETLLEAELFGHEKGAYTGAVGARAGRFEMADGGTLFLDEIGEIPASVQVKLLRVIQERELERLGSTKPVRVDVRLVAATNRNLEHAVEAGVFRADLYYRLQVVSIELPPLRERPVDVKPLAEFFIHKYAPENGRPTLRGVSPDALGTLLSHRWPGNVRELENVIERAVVLSKPDAELITPELLPTTLKAA